MSDSVEYKPNNISALRADVNERTNVLKRTIDKLVDRERLDALRADDNERTNVLKILVDKLVDRGERLDALTAKADDLNTASGVYYGSTRRVHRRMKWQNYKITIFIVAVIVIVIAIIILVIDHLWKK